MAQLPDENIIALPAPGSARKPSTIDVGGYARGAAAVASGVEALGKGVTSAASDVAAVLKREREAEQKLGNASASAAMQSGLLEDAAAIDAEKDPTDLEARTKAKAKERLHAAKQFIKDERQQQLFELSQQDNITRVILAAKRKEFGLLSSAEMAADIASMNQAREHAIRQSGDNSKAMDLATGTIHGYVDKWVEKGYMDPVKAGEYKRKAAQDLAEGKLLALPPVEKYEALSSASAAQSAVRFFADKGLSRHAAAGIVGNLLQESAALDPNQSHDGNTGVGIAGWRDPPNLPPGQKGRRTALMEFAKERGLQWNSREAQLEFLWHELNTSENGVLQKLTNAKDAREAAYAFISFERPAGWTAARPELGHGYGNRVRNAERVMAGGGGGRHADVVAALPAGRLEPMLIGAEREYVQITTKASYDAFNATQQALDEAASGLSPLPPRESIENNPRLLPQDRSRARALYDTAAAKAGLLRTFKTAYDEGRSLNPSDDATRTGANLYFRWRGRGEEALHEIVHRTNIIPDDEVTALRGRLASGKVPEVFAAMKTLSDLPDQALVNLKDGGDLAEARETYRAKLTVGKSPANAVHDYVEERKAVLTPELARQKRENVDKLMAAVTHDKVRTYVQPDDWYALLSSAAPGLRYEAGGSNAEREAMLHQFREVVRDVYLKQRSPDIEEAMAKAAQQFKKTFGLSTTYGPDPTDPKQTWSRPRLMQYAPAAWSGYAPRSGEPPLEDIEGLIKKLAAKTVVKEVGDPYGYTPNPDNIMLTPLGFKQTAERFLVGDPNEPPAYLLSYKDQRGNIQTIGKFEAKPSELRQIQTEERDREMKKLEAADNALMDKRLLNMPQGKADRRLRLGTLSPGDYVRRQQLREESAKAPSRLATAAAEAGEIASGVGQAIEDEWKRSPWIY